MCYIFRCATGEAWPDIMLAGVAGRPCDERAYERNKTTGLDKTTYFGSSLNQRFKVKN